MTLSQTLADELRHRRVVAVLRADSAAAAAAAGRALAAGGVSALEVAFTTPDAPAAVRSLARDPDLLVGAGTVLSADQARAAVAAGAAYLVAPNFDPAVADAADALAVPLLAGVLTPTEVARAAGRCPLLKLFPASLGGPAYLRALRGPFPNLAFVPTGGVTAENATEWLAAGALAVGAGGDLCPADAIDAGDAGELSRRAAAYAAAVSGVPA
jgi:2-dehydro-3-deoxyphosphogluconate aldolase / (4S)-4-hydroxy-2-oxoglutarate aldolase